MKTIFAVFGIIVLLGIGAAFLILSGASLPACITFGFIIGGLLSVVTKKDKK